MQNVAAIEVRPAEFVCVTALFGDTVLDTRSLVASDASAQDYLIGEDPRAAAPARGLPVPLFPLVRMTGAGCEIAWCEGMSGHVTLADSRRMTLGELVEHGEAERQNLGHVWWLPHGAHCRIDVADTTFVMEASVRPERVASPPLSTDRDALFYDGVSLAAHAMILFLVFSVPPRTVRANPPIGTAVLAATFAPRPKAKDALPDWLRRPPEMTPPDATRRRPHARATSRVAPQPPGDGSAGDVARRVAMDRGVLAILSSGSGSLQRLFSKDSALGEGAPEALDDLTGSPLGAGLDMSGLTVSRTGSGGPDGVAYGQVQTKAGPRGGSLGPPGSLGPHRPEAPQVIPGAVVIRGALDREIIRRVVRKNANQIRYCYEAALRRNPGASGRVSVQFLIGGQGQVLTSRVQASDLHDAEAEQCITAALRRWAFPAPSGGGTVLVNYPFLLRATGE